jgi:hypothetical protein
VSVTQATSEHTTTALWCCRSSPRRRIRWPGRLCQAMIWPLSYQEICQNSPMLVPGRVSRGLGGERRRRSGGNMHDGHRPSSLDILRPLEVAARKMTV